MRSTTKQNAQRIWATCDTISSKVFSEMVKIEEKNSAKKGKTKSENGIPLSTVPILISWKDSANYWQQRASCVSFVKLAKTGKYTNSIMEICKTCVKSPERFVQLGNGWVLREVSVIDLGLVVGFIQENYNSFSREGLRYAIEKMNEDLRQKLLKYDPANGNLILDTTNPQTTMKRKKKTGKKKAKTEKNEERAQLSSDEESQKSSEEELQKSSEEEFQNSSEEEEFQKSSEEEFQKNSTRKRGKKRKVEKEDMKPEFKEIEDPIQQTKSKKRKTKH